MITLWDQEEIDSLDSSLAKAFVVYSKKCSYKTFLWVKCNFLLKSNVSISPGKLISDRKVIAADTIQDSFMGETLQIN